MPAEISFEVKAKDLAGRIGKLAIKDKTVETPLLMPVYNPNKPLIPIEEMKERFGIQALMTNSYIILKSEELKKSILEKGIHGYLGFDGLVATDSGSFQLMAYGSVSTTNAEIIRFQESIGSDIGSFLDIPTLPDAYKPQAADELETTLERAKEAVDAKFAVNAGIQGSTHMDLRKKAAQEIGRDFKLCAVGGIVRLMEEYRFTDLVDVIAAVKMNLPANRPIHAFGLGHPMVFSLAAALGCDLFDSAAYALYAQDGRYMTEYGTKRLENLEYLPCSCPICREHGIGLKDLSEEEMTKELALHNLYVSFAELDRVKQAIREGSLWNLLSMRARAHPAVYAALLRLKEYSKWMAELDSVTKGSQVFYAGKEAGYRPEVLNARRRIKQVASREAVDMPPFGKVPAELLDIYPFGGFVSSEVDADSVPPKVSDLEKVRAIMDYQFGRGAGELIENSFRIKKSRTTHRIRWIYRGKEMVASVRASDHFIIPHDYLAEKLKERFAYPRLRVVLHDDAVPFVKDEGKSVFCKFVTAVDKDLRAGDEVLVVDKDDVFIRTGTLVLSPKEVLDFDRGAAVKVR
jgi:7-cyano-7-deazaguanine tRNA-ribosyltransferase